MTWFLCMVFILLLNIGWYTVSSVEITKSISPSPPYRIEKPPTITWSIKYKEDEQDVQYNLLYLNGLEKAIASSANGLTKEGKAKLNGKANVTITSAEVCVKFFRLEYVDEFNFTCSAYGGNSFRSGVEKESKLYISNIKGGPSFHGDSGLKDEYVFSLGNSTFDVTICGHDRPKLWYTFGGKTKEAESTIVDVKARKYKYKIMIEDLKAEHCGQKLIFKSVGFGEIVKRSKVFVKYQPPIIKEFLRDQHQNCSIINIKHQQNTACPLKYIITIYDAQKNILKGISRNIRNPVTTETDSIKICLLEWYKNGEYATVQAVWEHQSFQKSIKGEVSDFVKVQKGYDDRPKSPKDEKESLVFVIPLVFGLVIIVIVSFIFSYRNFKRKQNKRDSETGLMYKPAEANIYTDTKTTQSGSESTDISNVSTYTTSTSTTQSGRESTDIGNVLTYEPRANQSTNGIYAELGRDGGRTGAKPPVYPSNYAEAKDVYNEQDRQEIDTASEQFFSTGFTRNDDLPIYEDPKYDLSINPPEIHCLDRKNPQGEPEGKKLLVQVFKKT